MINIKSIAERLLEFCKTSERIEKFKIYIRLNFSLELYAITTSDYSPEQFIKDFMSYTEETFNESVDIMNLKVKIYLSGHSMAYDDPLWQDIFEGENNVIENGPRLRFNAILNNKKAINIRKKAPIITFYSYKGGMGRTTTMVSYAIDLAVNSNKKVCIIDCDLEAPGYLNFFNLSEHESLNSGKINGLVEFLSDLNFSKNPENIKISDNYLVNVAYGNYAEEASALDNIYLMPAGNLNEDFDFGTGENRQQYLEGLSRINLSNETSVINSFQILLDKINEEIEPDIILLDSRTGFNDIIGTASLYLADIIVGFFGFNEQTVPGLLNLIDSYYNNSNYKLILVSSILPEEDSDSLLTKETNTINRYINLKYGSQGETAKDTPILYPLHRNIALEKIGLSAKSHEDFIKTIMTRKIKDYTVLFDAINEHVIPRGEQEDESDISSKVSTLQLRNIVLKGLKETLSSIKSFAEITDVNENLFFYRKCMNELFEEKKFLICGYKGTGKTYLYKALANTNETANTIAAKILKKANVDRKDKKLPPLDLDYKLKFVNIISYEENGDKMFDFRLINIAQISEPEYFFNCFWQIHTWMSVLLDPDFSIIRDNSALKDYVKPIHGAEAVKRFNELINKGIDTLIEIENDFLRLNEYLVTNRIKLFLMYDQLDTRINPKYWGKAVSPLIAYWREKWITNSNILPKIFIRTDLFKRIEGTNTARLEDNIISIEWTIEEVFAYFFKLLFSDNKVAKAFWEFSKRIHLHNQHREIVKKELKQNDNQFITLERTHIGPLVDIVFGKKVLTSKLDENGKHIQVNLGNPWNYFFTNLANADNRSISLRPFINMLDGNAVDLALKVTKQHIKQIIPPEIYASREVQLRTATSYFDDLTQDDFSKDLICVRDFINSDKGLEFRYKTLSEESFNKMIKYIFNDNIGIFKSVRNEEDLKLLLYASGIVAEKARPGGKIYQFASMYAYSWALKTYDKRIQYKEGMKMKGIYSGARKSVNAYGGYYRVKNILEPIEDGQFVEFTIHIDEKKPNFRWAANVKGVSKQDETKESI